MRLHRSARRVVEWVIEGLPEGTATVEMSLDDGATWAPVAVNEGVIQVLVAGPDATGNPAETVVLPLGTTAFTFRAVTASESVPLPGGAVTVTSDVTRIESWPVEWPAGAIPAGASEDQVAQAERFAVQTLRMLTAYRVGGEPVTVMPGGRCNRCTYHSGWVAGWIAPYLLDGKMYNGCGHPDRVYLPGPVGRVYEVVVDDVVLAPTAYRVEDGADLVRLDGAFWPVIQSDQFTVTYQRGHAVDGLARYAAGILAREFLKALVGGPDKCRLPANVTALTRQGVSMTLATGMFPGGFTGIAEVDTFIRMWNPHALKSPPEVYSPDLDQARQITGQHPW